MSVASHPRTHALPRVARTFGICALAFTSACHVWKPAELDPAHEYLNGRTRVYRNDGTSVIVVGPRVVGDSIVGRWPNGTARIALARADVQRVEVSRVSRGRTALLGLGLFAVNVVAQIAFADAQKDYPY